MTETSYKKKHHLLLLQGWLLDLWALSHCVQLEKLQLISCILLNIDLVLICLMMRII
jgi:hypothetical protein